MKNLSMAFIFSPKGKFLYNDLIDIMFGAGDIEEVPGQEKIGNLPSGMELTDEQLDALMRKPRGEPDICVLFPNSPQCAAAREAFKKERAEAEQLKQKVEENEVQKRRDAYIRMRQAEQQEKQRRR